MGQRLDVGHEGRPPAHALDRGADPGRARVAGVQGVEARGDELIITAINGPATIGPVAVALNGAVRELTLRTPTLDDVFLELTGNRIENESATELVEVGQ